MSANKEEQFLPFSRPSISRAAIDEVVACLESGWITTGPRVKKFEDDLKSYVSAPHALVLSSATAGLHLVLAALELKPIWFGIRRVEKKCSKIHLHLSHY